MIQWQQCLSESSYSARPLVGNRF